MCGIFGLAVKAGADFSRDLLRETANDLFVFSESRGKEASGIALQYEKTLAVYKEPLKASRLIDTPKYKQMFRDVFPALSIGRDGRLTSPAVMMGHSRLVTSGSRDASHNNQPLIKDQLAVIHNGIIVNADELWKRYPSLERKYEVDTEIIPALIHHFGQKRHSRIKSICDAFYAIRGASSVALLCQDTEGLFLATNNGSLYTGINDAGNIFLFASERGILERFAAKRKWERKLGAFTVRHLRAGRGCFVCCEEMTCREFSLHPAESEETPPEASQRRCEFRLIAADFERPGQTVVTENEKRETLWERVFLDRRVFSDGLRRCVKCILPETMPFIRFDERGVCHYCRQYKERVPRGQEALEKRIGGFRNPTGDADCLVGISGGRDSCYGLHYIKRVLGMNPVAYTYDWGMVTDLARRNIARLCGELGVEHIVVSADIEAKRRFIRQNVEAWLKKPRLGMIPLFMAGDKDYFYHARRVKQRMGLATVFLCENMLERTDFKSGFCGVTPDTCDEEHVYTLSVGNQMRLAAYYGIQFLSNPAYLNASLWDTARAYISYYLLSRDYVNLYLYVPWSEEKIADTLVNQYGWEGAADTRSTWRVGDGTSAFYNYIYYMTVGFTEHDTFRSNQIREGTLTRDQALALAREENRPRYDSIRWYCDTIGVDFRKTINIIHALSGEKSL